MLPAAFVLLCELVIIQDEAFEGPTPIRFLEIGRNEPCHCSSGKNMNAVAPSELYRERCLKALTVIVKHQRYLCG